MLGGGVGEVALVFDALGEAEGLDVGTPGVAVGFCVMQERVGDADGDVDGDEDGA